MIDIKLSGVQYGVNDYDDGAGVLLAFKDAESGVLVTVVLSHEAAEDIAKRLRPTNLEIVSAIPDQL